MKRFIHITLLVAQSSFAMSQLKIVPEKSSVQFSVKNFGITVEGKFNAPSGNISFDPNHPETSSFSVTVDARTVNTDNSLRDSHLRKESYFDTDHYPNILFESIRIMAAGKKGTFIVSGRLATKNRTKDISFPFTAVSSGNGYFLQGSFTINRKDFDIGGTSIISDEVKITVSVLADK